MFKYFKAKSSRNRAAKTAKAMLDGSMDYLEGSQVLSTIRYDVGLEDRDPDFEVFVLIDSETDSLPIGHARQYWNKEALEKLQPEYDSSIEWAKRMSQENCKSIVRRFGA